MSKISCPPDPGLLKALCAQPLTFKLALGELIDNALDAGANTIAIDLTPKVFTIRDNGLGCAHLESFVTLGEHRHQRTTKLGRFGIGAKDGVMWLGGENSQLTVRSVHSGKARELQMRWADMARNRWEIDAPEEVTIKANEIGTTIEVRPLKRTIPHGAALNELLVEIGYLYSPAIKRGAQITIRASGGEPKPVPRWELPPLEPGHAQGAFSVDGKSVRFMVGIVREGVPNSRSGLTYMHGFRVIIPASASGCGEFNTSRICGWVELDDSWALSKNKNDIVGDAEALYAEVERQCIEVLRRAEEQGQRLQSHAFETEVSALLNVAMGRPDAKAVRAPGGDHGTSEPKKTGRRHRKAAIEQDGSTFASASRAGSIRIVHGHLGNDDIGEAKGSTITLNLDNPWIRKAYDEKNAMAQATVAASILSGDLVSTPKGTNLKLRFDADASFGRVLGGILAKVPDVSAQRSVA